MSWPNFPGFNVIRYSTNSKSLFFPDRSFSYNCFWFYLSVCLYLSLSQYPLFIVLSLHNSEYTIAQKPLKNLKSSTRYLSQYNDTPTHIYANNIFWNLSYPDYQFPDARAADLNWPNLVSPNCFPADILSRWERRLISLPATLQQQRRKHHWNEKSL